MDKLTAMGVFVAVVDGGSQVAAAEQLGLSTPVVSRSLSELEDWLGVRLLHRTTRRLSLTEAGTETLHRCRALLEQAQDLRAAVASQADAPQGLLRVTAATSFGQAQLAQAVAAFSMRYPAVTIDMVLLDRAVNLVEERIDLAIRISNDLDPGLIARKLTVCRSVVCASPDYVRQHGAPRRLEELGMRNCLTHAYHGKSLWHFDRKGEPVSVAVGGNISANESMSLLHATLSGAGVALMPTYLVGPLIRSGQLVALLPADRPRELDVQVVYASRKHMTSALRALLDFLVEVFPSEPHWDR